MSDITWNEGLAAKAVKAVEGKFENANRHVREGEQSLLRAGRELRIVLRTYLKNDKERFVAAASMMFDRGPSAAYEYVQAADAEAHFADAVAATGTDTKTVGVRTWAKLDRFTGTDDLKATGHEVIKAEAARAKADGTKAFTNAGLADTIKAVKGDGGEATGTDDERKVGRVAGKYRDDLRSEFARFVAVVAESGDRAGFAYAIRKGAEWGAASGSLTPQALTSLVIEWAANDKAAELEAKAIQRKAEREAKVLAEQREAAASLKPQPKPQAKVTETQPKAPAPKRTRKAPAKTGTKALVENAPQTK